MRWFVLCLLLAGECFGQSIVMSGGRQSIIMSGVAGDPVGQQPVNVHPVDQPKSKRREWYLVSEQWCSHCPAAKRVFLSKGWPESNILTIAECERRFGFRVPHVPFEFGEPQRVVSRAVVNQRVRQRLPVVQTQWGTIDLETYHRNCNCPMCRGIRALQAQYRTMSIERSEPEYNPDTGQEACPDETIDQALDLLQLTPSDTLADLGCGDGRVMIRAVRRHGCRAVGIEIDSTMADCARLRVAKAGLSDRINIITGDALNFRPADHCVTAVYCYLYPNLLEKLSGTIQIVSRAVTPFHPVAGLSGKRVGDVYVYNNG